MRACAERILSLAGDVQNPSQPDSLNLVDECSAGRSQVHYLGDPDRGSVWEETIINCPPHVQLMAMSATVANPDDLGGWIGQVPVPQLDPRRTPNCVRIKSSSRKCCDCGPKGGYRGTVCPKRTNRYLRMHRVRLQAPQSEVLGVNCRQVHGECETTVTRFRPVPLTWQYCYDNEDGTEMVKLLDKKQRALNPALAPTPRQFTADRNRGERRRCVETTCACSYAVPYMVIPGCVV